ncbi:hypothetical protein L1049_022337 [Liquidambar formosana]|uniref:Uncharacterized protein n=1 Tax=Liquidambar formosana TaxID=63359 RepID=A0AAP0WQY5_LIQFO
MGTSEECAVPRLKREECTRTKHDSVFSEWKILVGPSDWEDHSLGKEGATRYRVHNLPTSSGSGVYELGIAVSHTGLGREVGKLDPHGMFVVYLGQADNVRTRLQSYGRSGAHLCNSYSTGQQKNGPCLFDEIFSKGYSILFRWAPMKNKGDAKKTEAQLLDRFDYAWNKGSNGPRRHCDVLQKLGKLASRTTWIPNIARKLQILNQKPVGIRINARKPLLLQNESSTCTEEESNSSLSQVFRFSRSRPRLIFVKPQVGNEDFIPTCGVTLDDGTPCRRPPVPGRKRCEEHKGRRICGSISYSVTDGRSSYVHDVVLDSSSRNDQEYDTCGITLDDGTSCRRPSVPGRKRCEEHKGRRIFVVLDSSSCNDQDYDPCGIILEDGTPCRRSPVPGRKRCEEHKGRRICGSISNSVMYGKSSYEHGVVFDSSSRNDQAYDTCGVDLGSGIYCRTQPIAGRKRCEEHKGMRVNGLVSRLAAEDKPHVSDSGCRI